MLEDNSLRAEANINPLQGQETIDTFFDPVARLWCRSFGVTDRTAIERLKSAMRAEVQTALRTDKNSSRLQHALDKAAENVIREWFSFVLGREIPSSGKSLALLRLAFLDCNYGNKWSADFLSPTVYIQELNAEIQSVMMEPTPLAKPRLMIRQAI